MRFIIFAAILLLCGCAKTPEVTPEQADYIALTIMAAQINASQTNWTVIIERRTNQP